MLLLTEFEKIAILSGCVGLLFLVIVLTVCFVCPFCWFYKLITRRKLKEDDEMNYCWNHYPEKFLDHDPPPPYEASSRSSFFEMQSHFNFNRRLTPMNSVSTISSDTDSVTGIPLPQISDIDLPPSKIPESLSYEPGNVSITLQFKRIKGEGRKVISQLRIDMKEATDLPIRAYGGNCDPYFIIRLYDKNISKKEKKKFKVPLPLHEFYTTTVKKSQHPVYNESFFFPLEPHQVKKSVLKFEAWDQDKLANDTAVGEAYFSLKDVSSILLQEPSKELELNLKLEDSRVNNGQLLLGLCYLPTAERITVAVLKANNLKRKEENLSCDFYVKALAMYGGKVFERRKTSSHPSSSVPVFNEMLMFDVPFSKLDHAVLIITICSTSKEEIVKGNHQKAKKDTCIGKVVIGSYSRKNTLNHWNAMRNSPRRQIIQWHDLR